jgi:DNA polymerase-3 subunit alpha
MKRIIEEYKKVGYRNLHLHTDASHLDGMNDLPSLIKRLKEIGHTACAITDHGNMHNVLRFYQTCKVNDIKPLLGFEAYISDVRQLQKKSDFLIVEEWIGDDFAQEICHLVLLAENFKGYQNLCRLTTLSGTEGFYSKPRIDYEILKEYSEGVIVINGHVGTDIAKAVERASMPVSKSESMVSERDTIDYPQLLDVIEREKHEYAYRETQRAFKLNEWYMEVFGDRYYLELQNHTLEIEKLLNPFMIKLSQEYNIPLVMTNDSHYTWRSDADTHRIHFANGIGQDYEELVNGVYEGFSNTDEFYVKDDEEMLEVAIPFGVHAVQALINTNDIVERCNVTYEQIELKGIETKKGQLVGKWKTKEYLFPDFPIPMPFADKESYFRHLVNEGFKERVENEEVDLEGYTLQEYIDRLEYEMGVIIGMGFPTYFTILWDVLRFCREQDIPVGKGRGSGAGSLVAYSLRITDVDPLHYKLLFERFLNPDRISMPDIDLDFCYDRIQEVIDYTKEKYGHDRVCKIGTFGTLSAKAVIKDVARVLKYDYQMINSLTTKVTEIGIKIKDILINYPEFKELYDEDVAFKRIIDTGLRLEGLQRHTSQHAAGIVISPFPLTDLVPLKGKGGDLTAQLDMHELEELGFVKMDYLRLRTLTVIKNAVNSIYEQLGEHIAIDKIDFADPKVFEKFQHGDSLGIFQFESAGMQGLLKKQHPTSIEDLSAVNSLYRPGPLDMKIEDENDPNYGKTMVDIYLARASGEQEVAYDHPLLEEIQKPTYGIFVYQEQLMFGSVALAGYSLPESDELRKVVGKKLLDLMPAQKEKFVKGCLANPKFIEGCEKIKNSNPKELAEFIFSQIETFGRYGFNKSHSTAYAILAYQSMWLKTYYPEFFMASVLTSYIGEKIEKIVPYLNEARRLGLKLLAPDVNRSTLKFEVSTDRKGIHFSLNGIVGVGRKAVENILEVRKNHGFKTLSDFIMLTGSAVNKTVTVALAEAGAFDFLGHNRRTMVKIVQDLIAISSKVKTKITNNKKRKNPVQDISSFYQPFYEYEAEVLDEFTHEELCQMERTLTGFYMTHHPLEGLIDFIQAKTTHSSDIINNGVPIEIRQVFDEDAIVISDSGELETEYQRLPQGQFVITGGVIKQVKEITIKRGRNQGKKMASIVVEDAYQGDIKCTVFNQQYEKLLHVVKEGKVVFIKGNVDYFNDSAQVNVVELSEVSRDSAKSLRRNELLNSLSELRKTIDEIEETITLLGDDANLIVDITDELINLYDKHDKIYEEFERLEFGNE